MIVCFDRAAMEYTGAEREFGNFQMNPNDEVPTEISNSDEELLNSFDPTVLEKGLLFSSHSETRCLVPHINSFLVKGAGIAPPTQLKVF